MEPSDTRQEPNSPFNIGLTLSSSGDALAVVRDSHRDSWDDEDEGDLVAAGRHSLPGRRSRSRSGGALGADAVTALAGGVGAQIQTMARKLSQQLSEPESDPAPKPGGWRVEEVTLTFGVSATATVGQGLAVLVDLGGETNIEVTLTLRRSAPDPAPAST